MTMNCQGWVPVERDGVAGWKYHAGGGLGARRRPGACPTLVGWQRKVFAWLQKTRVPVLGICLGHQMLGRAAGGRMQREGEKGDVKEGVEETGDFWLDEKAGSATLTEEGVHKVEDVEERVSSLWLVASREHSPGLVATYRLDYPYWGFEEMEPRQDD